MYIHHVSINSILITHSDFHPVLYVNNHCSHILCFFSCGKINNIKFPVNHFKYTFCKIF